MPGAGNGAGDSARTKVSCAPRAVALSSSFSSLITSSVAHAVAHARGPAPAYHTLPPQDQASDSSPEHSSVYKCFKGTHHIPPMLLQAHSTGLWQARFMHAGRHGSLPELLIYPRPVVDSQTDQDEIKLRMSSTYCMLERLFPCFHCNH